MPNFQPSRAAAQQIAETPLGRGTCATCLFSEPNLQQDGQVVCFRYPPWPQLLNVRRGDKEQITATETLSLFPLLAAGSWCGEYQPKVKPE